MFRRVLDENDVHRYTVGNRGDSRPKAISNPPNPPQLAVYAEALQAMPKRLHVRAECVSRRHLARRIRPGASN